MSSLCSNASRLWRREVAPLELLRKVFDFSTVTRGDYGPSNIPSPSFLSSPKTRDSLYSRILPIGAPTASVAPILDQWSEQGNKFSSPELLRIIKQLRSYRRHRHALQVSDWMAEKLKFDFRPRDIAVRLDLISKVHGIEHAEKYFDSIPDDQRGMAVYGALLHCYAHSKSLEKAESTMQKLRDMGFATKPLPFNAMLNLYYQVGKTDKLDEILQEMEDKGISFNEYTYSTRLNAYIAASDVDGMEKFLTRMKSKPRVHIDWNAYMVAANGYQKAGRSDKATEMLKKAEKLVRGEDKRTACELLISMYAGVGKKDEVYRIWSLLKAIGKVHNLSYLCVVSALLKLDDIDGAEKLVEEWESGKNKSFDFRIPNVLISGYCKKGLIDKAEEYVNRLVIGGKQPNASTWGRLATGYCQANQMDKAVETIKKGIMAGHPRWKPNPVILASCLEFLKERDCEEAEESIKLLKEHCKMPAVVDQDSLNETVNDEASS